MITLFRRIRQKLIDSGSVTKYMLYAIGEILLVVVGILIALQFSNWNTQRLENKAELEILRSLRAELYESRIELKNDSTSNIEAMQATERVYQFITDKSPYKDSLLIDFYEITTFNNTFPVASAYEALKSQGINKLKNDSLIQNLAQVYEKGYTRLQTKADTRRNAHRVLFPYYQEHFRTVIPTPETRFNTLYAEPNDLSFIREDPQYQSLVVLALAGRENYSWGFESSLRYVDKAIAGIDAYINTF